MNKSRFGELEELERDVTSAAFVLARLASGDGKRSTLDEAITLFGFNRKVLEAELESELAAGVH